MSQEAKILLITGIVQGVGFRPFIYKLAHEMGIKGWVNNSSQGVTIHAEGGNLDLFSERLRHEAPQRSRIQTYQINESHFKGYHTFEIAPSVAEHNAEVLISPDLATCDDCLVELENSKNPRYQYPLINCTNCGPRYTIIRDVPYDRVRTTLSDFPMCKFCTTEYQDPLNRRFHAEPVACPECGPKVELRDSNGEFVQGMGIEQLAQGAILAVKGLGGFHLVCDARSPEAVHRLRERKERGAKPFALMARSVAIAREEVDISPREEKLLKSPAAPIVICERRLKSSLPQEIAPGIHTLGVMLPYTPIHHLLMAGPFDFLVMTSANLSGQPLIYENEEAINGLKGIADYFLIHNRDIYHPCDDSVVQVIGEEAVFLRRARGYVPLPLQVATPVKTPLLGLGGELKNTFCMASGSRAFVSQYLGDMENYDNLERYYQELESFKRVVHIKPEALAYDHHPNYQLSQYARKQTLPKHAVQHHHAHLVSVLGEWNRTEPTLGIICDGTGFGADGRIWGFEVLYGNASGVARKGHLEYLPLPGGDAGSKHPLRMAYAYLKTLLTEEEWRVTEPFWTELSVQERKILDRQLLTGVQVFQTSSAGRLFDAVSGLLGICRKVTYEGQAAIELESSAFACKKGHKAAYPYEIKCENSQWILKVGEMFRAIMEDLYRGSQAGEIAYRFHITIAQAIVDLVLCGGNGPVVLSGGVFQNKLLTETVLDLCEEKGIEVLRSRMLPPGDGGISFGQILIANEVL